jgi:hypothetical protein
MFRQRLHLPFTNHLPQLVAALPLVAPPPHIRHFALPSPASCHVSFLFAPASCCVVSCQPVTLRPPPSIASPAHGWLLHLPSALLSLITVLWPLLTLHCRLPFRLSQASCPASCCIASLLSSWLLHCLSSCHPLPSAAASASHCAITSCHAPLHTIASRTSSLAGCCVASPHAAASHLPAHLPLIALSPLIAPWPPVPLVRLVVALPLLTPLPPICWQLCLSLCCPLLSCPSPCHCLLCL